MARARPGLMEMGRLSVHTLPVSISSEKGARAGRTCRQRWRPDPARLWSTLVFNPSSVSAERLRTARSGHGKIGR